MSTENPRQFTELLQAQDATGSVQLVRLLATAQALSHTSLTGIHDPSEIPKLTGGILADSGQFLSQLPVELQAEAIERIEASGEPVAEALRYHGAALKLASGHFEGKTLENPAIDPETFRLQRGHNVEVISEVPVKGVSRAYRGFIERSLILDAAGGNVIGVRNESIPSGEAEEITPGTPVLDPLPTQIGRLYVGNRTSPRSANLAISLVRMYLADPTNPVFMDPYDTQLMLLGMTQGDYNYQITRGEVAEPPTGKNGAVLTLVDGTLIDQNNIRLVHVIGANTINLLQRGEEELYYLRPVRVYWNAKNIWLTGKVVDLSHSSLVQVDTENSTGLDEAPSQLTVGVFSKSLDLRDPSLPEKAHPLDKHPGLVKGRVVSVTGPDCVYSGVVEQIDLNNLTFEIATPEGYLEVPLHEPYYLWEKNKDGERDETIGLAQDDLVSWFDSDLNRTHVARVVGINHGVAIGKVESSRVLNQSRYVKIDRANIASFDVAHTGEYVPLEERFSCLNEWKEYYREKPIVRFRNGEIILEAELLTRQTYPFFVELIIKKSPDEIEASETGSYTDSYKRFRASPEDIIDITYVKQSTYENA